MRERGYRVGNIDCTIIAQRPKLSPHKETIRANLCELLGAEPSGAHLGGVSCRSPLLPPVPATPDLPSSRDAHTPPRMPGSPRAVVNVKAKTHEKVDSLGENRSIAAEAVVLLLRDEVA